MIELYAIYRFCRLIGRWLRAKGIPPLGYQVIFIAFWFFCEFMGGVDLRHGDGAIPKYSGNLHRGFDGGRSVRLHYEAFYLISPHSS